MSPGKNARAILLAAIVAALKDAHIIMIVKKIPGLVGADVAHVLNGDRELT
jgi:hypothetical protein